jgi:hypothetical protein
MIDAGDTTTTTLLLLCVLSNVFFIICQIKIYLGPTFSLLYAKYNLYAFIIYVLILGILSKCVVVLILYDALGDLI